VTLAEVVGINSAVALTFDDPVAATETLGALDAVEPVEIDGDVHILRKTFQDLGDEDSHVPVRVGKESAHLPRVHVWKLLRARAPDPHLDYGEEFGGRMHGAGMVVGGAFVFGPEVRVRVEMEDR